MKIKKKLIIIGSGGNADVISSTINDINQIYDQIEILGYLDDVKTKKEDKNILGKINKKNIDKFKKFRDIKFIWTLRSTNLREKATAKFYDLDIPNNKLLTIKHPTAVVSKYSRVGKGTSIHPFVNIGPGVIIKNNVHIFSNSLIGHNSQLNNFSYVANNSSIGAFVKIKEGGYVGMNSSIKERVIVGKWSTVGMGAVVVKNVKNYITVVGNPAVELRK